MQRTASEQHARRSDGVARQQVTLASSEVAAKICLSAHAASGGVGVPGRLFVTQGLRRRQSKLNLFGFFGTSKHATETKAPCKYFQHIFTFSCC